MTNNIYQDTVIYGDLDVSNGTVGNNIQSQVHPINSIYISVNNTSPGSLFGGTWEQIEDVFLLAAGQTYTAGSTGGEATHALTVAEIAQHWHKIVAYNDTGVVLSSTRTGSNSGLVMARDSFGNYSTSPAISQLVTSNTGGSFSSGEGDSFPTEANGNPHNNMPPYLTVYMWQRVA